MIFQGLTPFLPIEIPDPNAAFQIGTAEGGHPERVFRGSIDDVLIYNRALFDSEIQSLAQD